MTQFAMEPRIAFAIVAFIFAGAIPAYAFDTDTLVGVSGESGDTEGVFEAACQDLRDISGLDGGDVLFACDADRQECRLFSLEFDEGTALGFCDDSFDQVVQPVRGGGALEEDVEVQATTFGLNTGLLQSDSSTADFLCETFERQTTGGGKKGGPKNSSPSPGIKVCRKIVEDQAGCSAGTCDQCDDFIITRSDSCATLQDLLAGSVTGDLFPNISFGLFIDVNNIGQPGSEALLVCPGFRWECVAPEESPLESATVIQYQFRKGVIQTPGCVWVGGTCYKY